MQRQWLVSPETTGWVGGVHAPVRVVQMYLMLASKLTTRLPLAANLHYVTLLREPTRRFTDFLDLGAAHRWYGSLWQAFA